MKPKRYGTKSVFLCLRAADTGLVVAAPGVLGNDTDPDGDALSAVLVANLANGTLALSDNGSFTYTPGPGYYGQDSFTYKATDGTDNSTAATVTIGVSEAPADEENPPSAGGGGSAGTPSDSLSVPDLIDFGAEDWVENFGITNASGVGTMQWRIGEPEYLSGSGWIGTIAPDSGETTGTSDVTMTVRREGRAPGEYEALLPVTSNAGEAEIRILMQVLEPVPEPALSLDTELIDFGLTETEAVFTIDNAGGAEVVWGATVGYVSGEGWLSLDLQEGTLEAYGTQELTLQADRTGLAPGVHAAVVIVFSEHGTREIDVSVQVPGEAPLPGGGDEALLTVIPRLCLFLARAKTVDAAVVENPGTGLLSLSVGEPEYGRRAEGWLSVESDTLELGPGEYEMLSMTVDRDGLAPGLYTARVSLSDGDGSEETMRVIMRVPLF
ncbi:Ig-like domain-containing protein [Thermodesulfobacteriota bacterium]